MTELLFFVEVVVAGLLAGTMYSLVALGFVLIYKASSTFNFAQGAMVFFAVLAFVGFMEAIAIAKQMHVKKPPKDSTKRWRHPKSEGLRSALHKKEGALCRYLKWQ